MKHEQLGRMAELYLNSRRRNVAGNLDQVLRYLASVGWDGSRPLGQYEMEMIVSDPDAFVASVQPPTPPVTAKKTTKKRRVTRKKKARGEK